MGIVRGICVSEKRGTQKHEVMEAEFVADWGIRDDAHAGKWHRQVSLLSLEKIEAFQERGADVVFGAFGENLIVEGYDFKKFPVGSRFRCGEVLLEMTQIGKECHSHCEIYQKMGECIMPREGVFAKVLEGGTIHRGDTFEPEYSDLYHMIADRKADKSGLVATVVEGAHAGEQIFFVEGENRWQSASCGMLKDHQKELAETKKSGLMEIAGERIFCDWVGGERILVICGAGHVSIPIIDLGKKIGFKVIVLEDRPKFADDARRAKADVVICDSFENGMKQITGSTDTYFVVVTRGHRYDIECLRAALKKKNAYIGMMGSRRRSVIVKEQLKEEGFDREVLERICAPIGLPIGAETPEEIAVSVMAEIIRQKNSEKRGCGYDKELLGYLTEEKENGMTKVLATIVSRKGSAPREIGTKMLVLADGRTIGTIGGGCAESEVIQESLRMIREGTPDHKLMSVDMTAREAEAEGMVCGGMIEVYMELENPQRFQNR